MSWRLITLNAQGREVTSAPVKARKEGAGLGVPTQRSGIVVVVITGSEGDAIVEEITECCAARPLPSK